MCVGHPKRRYWMTQTRGNPLRELPLGFLFSIAVRDIKHTIQVRTGLKSDHNSNSIAVSTSREAPHISIRPSKGLFSFDFNEIWEYRELLYFLTWRDIVVRYKQSVLGIGWAILQPLLTMVIFTFVFGHVAKVPTNGIPYPLFCFAALIPWQYFSNSIGRAGTSLVGSSNLVSKVYFPRIIVPLAAAIAPLADFLVLL
jgi:lipopolysaccharide transport system permease protein